MLEWGHGCEDIVGSVDVVLFPFSVVDGLDSLLAITYGGNVGSMDLRAVGLDSAMAMLYLYTLQNADELFCRYSS